MDQPKTERPEIVTDEMIEYLDDLRESAIVNMFGAAPYVSKKFKLSIEDARIVLGYWMKTFGEESR